MTKGTMKTTSYLLITLLALLMSACNIINPDESLPGYIHIDVKYLPQMADEGSRRYLFVAIDRATRWVFIRIFKANMQPN